MAIKHKTYNELGDPKPNAVGWGLSLLGLLVLLSVMLWGQLAATGLRYARLQEQFTKLTGTGKHLHRLLENDRFQPILEQHRDALRALVPVVSFIDKGNLSRALALLNQPGAPHHPLLARLRDRISELAEADMEYEGISEEQTESSNLKESLQITYEELHRSLESALLGTETPAQPISSKGLFYGDGVLKGLPTVSGISDGIPSFENLALFAPAYRDSSDRLKRLFEKNVELWRARTEVLRPAIDNFFASHASRSQRLKELSTSRRANQKKAQTALVQVAQEFTRMVLSPSLVETYQRFQSLSRPFGVRAPELKTT